MNLEEEFAQKYELAAAGPMQVWLFCRLCRCRVQVRTIPRADLPFRCFCGYSGSFKKFDVFSDEDEARKFAQTFEEIYQTTKRLMSEAEMPLPTTRMYKADEIKRIKEGRETEDSAEDEAPPQAATEDAGSIRRQTREFTDAVVKARDVLERHDALSKLGSWAFIRRQNFPDARRVCYQACETDVQMAHEVVKEAVRRWKRGEPVNLRFPLFKRLIMLYVEDRNLEKALDVAVRGAQLGLPGYEERIEMLREKMKRQGG